jgi:hypothetical protein
MKTRQGKAPRKVASGMADTGSVVNTVKGYAVTGRLKVSGNDSKRNSMVSGNTGLKKRG